MSDRVLLKHPKGSSVEILFYGATVISWKSGNERNTEPIERLFVSSKAALDGSKPVRGGIPVVFPCFGTPTHPDHSQLSQHGFGRSEVWQWDGAVTGTDTGLSVTLTLGPTDKICKIYKRQFHLSYVVTLAEHHLTTELHVENRSTPIPTAGLPDVLEFQALLHNYIRAPSTQVLIGPLEQISYYDKTEATEEGRSGAKVETRAAVDVKTYTDSVYENAGQKYKLEWPGDGITISSTNFKDVVIWNPQENGRNISDMEDRGWERYVCVEPGCVRGFVKLEPGQDWVGRQVLADDVNTL
ncbi:galactose mutarotase-like protein [Tricholoma matsutake]|nr:galactose mutarotase-like protein [Tricholoma matsutake 945]